MSAPTLAVDIGGTKIAAGLVVPTRQGAEVLARTQVATPAMAGGRAVVAAVVEVIATLTDEAARRGLDAPGGVGIGSAGVVDESSGVVVAATDHIRDWAGTPLAAQVGAATGLATRVINDVHAHALGEFFHGAGRGHRSMLLVAAGTGVGGSFVLDGRPLLGARHAAGHLGHVVVPEAADLPCACGGVGHLEAVASGPGLATLYRRAGGATELDPRGIVAAAADDPIAARAVEVSGTAMGRAIGGWINLLDPGLVVVSGGLADPAGAWWEALQAAVPRETLPVVARCPVVPPTAGPDAALLGAAMLHSPDLGDFGTRRDGAADSAGPTRHEHPDHADEGP